MQILLIIFYTGTYMRMQVDEENIKFAFLDEMPQSLL
jgi:hypothetical protein